MKIPALIMLVLILVMSVCALEAWGGWVAAFCVAGTWVLLIFMGECAEYIVEKTQ
jgi:uncharacterized membrane protein YhhN